ncbi:hypothetical protein Taro_041745 [Colocasia esculenta]|uniref:RING-type E3 ubiquitin transferase n=1 Tax=Colocasia esculenta TaxID=4460 RepID=A0A843WM86_COLES|nr:hypothetical protein [Colocasia esculenta]
MASWASVKTSEPPPTPTPSTALDGSISPSVLLAIVVVAAVFFISGLLHLLVRYLLRPTRRELEGDPDGFTVLQGQLQQLFHLHDAGVDQSFIDSLPVFIYGTVVGPKEATFDCAVCLCEFEPDDRLRLLPRCSHAFHLECIDTWLLAHSTCPLCRGSLVPDPSPGLAAIALEPGGESSREIAAGRGDSTRWGHNDAEEPWSSIDDTPRKAGEGGPKEEALPAYGETPPPSATVVLPVKLGKFRNVDAGGGGEGSSFSSGSIDERRCFSMGSFEYVMDETTPLRVAIRPPSRKPITKRPGHRAAMSDCDGRREGLGLFQLATTTVVDSRVVDNGGNVGVGARSQRAESFSISKVWLRTRKESAAGEEGGSRRAFSFRLPLQQWRTPLPEMEASWPEKGGAELDLDVECSGCGSRVVSRAEESPSFARRTLQWMAGKRRKVVSHV